MLKPIYVGLHPIEPLIRFAEMVLYSTPNALIEWKQDQECAFMNVIPIIPENLINPSPTQFSKSFPNEPGYNSILSFVFSIKQGRKNFHLDLFTFDTTQSTSNFIR